MRLSRAIICLSLFLTAGISATLGGTFARDIAPQRTAWWIVVVGLGSAIRSMWSIFSGSGLRPHSSRSVAAEALSLFMLFPFQTITPFIATDMTTNYESNASVLICMKIFAIGSAILHVAYTFILISLAVLTVPAFDADVWRRDIDSSPSPFPLAIIFAFFCPCIARLFPATRSLVTESVPLDPLRSLCLPTCDPDCHVHGRPKTAASDAGEGQPLPTNRRAQPVLPHMLIRIPNSAELQSAIHVELPF
ncbi:hypothetical protein CPB84DRAFT_1782260 [Gymnopilus junonius]|uniref:Uncharacterized protein n=1 Tax=Gymnopilus junonius TaxID=109634 RepID=A0A9P5NII2_GYMJU|nr:hypothetical protein CPB84DRAFT_1782260 [Gymnopilus junonius]